MPTKMTITEGLAEVKTLKARIAKKHQTVLRYFSRDSKMRDPLEGEDGGSQEFVRKERQAIKDLEDRIVRIRCAIQGSNQVTKMTVRDTEKTVLEWLNWRREVAEPERDGAHAYIGSKAFLGVMIAELTKVRQAAQRAGYQVTDEDKKQPNEYIVAVNERQLAAEVEEHEALLGELDGKLSLANATTFIEA